MSLLKLERWVFEEPRKATAIFAAGVLALRWLLQRKIDRFRQVPGVFYLGVLPEIGSGSKLAEKLDEFSEKHGEEGVYEMEFVGTRTIVCCGWDAMSTVLKLRPFKVTKGGIGDSVPDLAFSDGVFFSEHAKWQRERRILSPAFNMKNVASYAPSVCAVMDQFMDALDEDCRLRGETNFSDLLPMLAADLVCKTGVGRDFGLLPARSQEEVKQVREMLNTLGSRLWSPLPYWKIPGLARRLDPGFVADEKMRQKLNGMLDNVTGEGATVFDKLKKMAAEGESLSREDLLGNLMVLFVAGTDTTSQALSWAFYQLACLPELQEELAAQLKMLPDGHLMPDQLESVELLSAMWLETLRFHGAAPFQSVMNLEPITLAGRTVPARTKIWLHYRYIMNNSPEMKKKLGEDLNIFRPARWIGPEGIIKVPPFDSLAFGHGPRICLGRHLADYEGKIVLAMVLKKFVLEKWTKPPMEERTGFLIFPAEDIVVRLSRRE
ncbi:CYP4C21 [Symbiodinium sp. CCMP2456]|nr:CYP4C21 [Symbiodinium sp. CCMP2456]